MSLENFRIPVSNLLENHAHLYFNPLPALVANPHYGLLTIITGDQPVIGIALHQGTCRSLVSWIVHGPRELVRKKQLVIQLLFKHFNGVLNNLLPELQKERQR